MIYKIFKNKIYLLLLLILALGIFFRFYNLNWGSPYYFHPDERNIASSISQLSYKNNLNPHFYAYGTLPIYFIYFLGVLVNFLQNLLNGSVNELPIVTFDYAIQLGRLSSALLSVLLIYLIYKFGCELFNRKSGLIGAVLATLSVGYIQYAHFATFEMWLSFFTLLLSYLLYNYLKSKNIYFFIFTAIVMGIIVSIKISSLIFLPLVLTILAINEIILIQRTNKDCLLNVEKLIFKIILFIGIAITIVVLTSPFFWLDNESFLSSIRYESTVAMGNLKVFYTQGFENTTPIIYQLLKVYPFILNPIIALSAFILIPLVIINSIKKRDKRMIFILLFLGVTFASQAFLFVKWTRYYVPSLGFIYIILGYYLSRLGKVKIIVPLLFVFSFLSSSSYFITVLLKEDTRVVASKWAGKNINEDAPILSEVYDMGIVPFNQYFPKITLFNFYELENDESLVNELSSSLKKSSYIILPSQRVMQFRLSSPKLFPKSTSLYQKLQNNIGYKLVYRTECDIFCNILYLGDTKNFEQTTNVFDRPDVKIYKKIGL